MERLTASPYTIKMYGFCGLTVVQEFAGRELSKVLDQERMDSTAKLQLAKKISQGVAHIHSIPGDTGRIEGPTLIHNDINLANLLFTADGRPVLNDFNIAIMLMKHNETGETCPVYSRFPNPQWKAPEEQVDDGAHNDTRFPMVNEKIDIYALGNIFFRMAVGSGPWKRHESHFDATEKAKVANLKRLNGTIPTIPDKILANATEAIDPALESLLAAMRWCYNFDPAQRPSATELVTFLDREIQKVEAIRLKRAPLAKEKHNKRGVLAKQKHNKRD
jgi:serine/threonine protein kinase